MAEFHFVRPYFLILLPLVLVLVINQLRAKSQGDWQKVMDKVLLSEIAKDNVEKSNIKAIKLSLFLGIALAVVAMAGPSWEKLPLPVFDTRDAKVFVLDLSPSMYSTDVTPSRVSRARHKLTDMIKRNQEGINALVVYAGSAHITSPLTDDVQTILNQISVLEPSIMPARGSHANEAIRVANQLFTEGQVAKGKVVLITDGNDAIPETAIEELRSKGHSLLVLAVGTEQGGPVRLPGGGFLKDTNGTIVVPKLESLEMSALARYAEGFSLIQSDQKDLDTLFANQSAGTISQENEEKEHNSQQWLERGPLLVLILIPFAFFLFRRDWLVCFVPVFLLAPSTDSYSMDWQSLWSNENQRAQQAYQDRDYEKASSLFTDGGWLGASQYRKGAYQKALTQFE
ncbi:MAG: VWA domain-containing protein, partial [Gammaproteobacteria bacterium]|nr:VWA domain-containing protein [Gammaproteobacteria bacterium]